MAGNLRLTRILFKAAPAPGGDPLDIEPSTVVVLIGPNNTGKSRTLREINYLMTGTTGQPHQLVSDIGVDWPTTGGQALDLLEPYRSDAAPGRPQTEGYIYLRPNFLGLGFTEETIQVQVRVLTAAVESADLPQLRRFVGRYFAALLDGRRRLALAEPQPAGDLSAPPENHLWALATNDDARARLRTITHAAFGSYFLLDATGITQFRIRMSSAPPTESLELSLGKDGLAFQAAATPILEMGDGVQAFTGLVAGVLSLPHRVILIDEPEAFLHPRLPVAWAASSPRSRRNGKHRWSPRRTALNSCSGALGP
jgi:predicted ATPase